MDYEKYYYIGRDNSIQSMPNIDDNELYSLAAKLGIRHPDALGESERGVVVSASTKDVFESDLTKYDIKFPFGAPEWMKNPRPEMQMGDLVPIKPFSEEETKDLVRKEFQTYLKDHTMNKES